jgi:hypothetical protein
MKIPLGQDGEGQDIDVAQARNQETDMKFNRYGVALIAVSLLAAAAMLLSANLIDERETSQTISLIIIAAWFIPFSYLSARSAKKGEDETSGQG